MNPNKQSNIKTVIDRIEGDLAVLEIEGVTEMVLPLKFLPNGIKPGNILLLTFSLDIEAEKEQREKIKKLQEKLKKDPATS